MQDFHGIPLKIINHNLKITLIDSVNKKVTFMNNIIDLLKINNIEAIHCRAEELAHNSKYREKFDTVVSRAVANMSTLVEYMIPFTKVGGRCICMKGSNTIDEINSSRKKKKKLGGQIEKVLNYNVEENERCLIIIKKIRKTEQTYPRKTGKPLKEPIS